MRTITIGIDFDVLTCWHSSQAFFSHGYFLACFPPKSVSLCLFYRLARQLTNLTDMYSQIFIKEKLTLKILVYAIYAVQLLQIVFFTNQAFKAFAAGFGDFVGLDRVGEIWFSTFVLDGLGLSCLDLWMTAID